jgi:hypothetical protein
MFQLHDKTRRRICLAAFALLCLAPTALVVGWCIAWRLPGHRQAEIERLQQQLGVVVTLDSLHYPRPGSVVYEGVALTDPETRQIVLRCRLLEATWTHLTDKSGQPHTAVLLSTANVDIEAAALDRLGELLQRILQGQATWGDAELGWTAERVTLRAGEQSQTLADVQGVVEAIRGGAQARAVFHLPGSATAEPMKIRLVRNRQVAPPTYGFELDTAGTPLPCGLLTTSLAELKSLGPNRCFCGHLWADQTPGGWTPECKGQLSETDPLSPGSAAALPQARLRLGRVIQR